MMVSHWAIYWIQKLNFDDESPKRLVPDSSESGEPQLVKSMQ